MMPHKTNNSSEERVARLEKQVKSHHDSETSDGGLLNKGLKVSSINLSMTAHFTNQTAQERGDRLSHQWVYQASKQSGKSNDTDIKLYVRAVYSRFPMDKWKFCVHFVVQGFESEKTSIIECLKFPSAVGAFFFSYTL